MNLKILKKSPIFTGVVCILLIAFLAQAALLVIKVVELSKAKRIYRSESATLEELASFKYALTPEMRSTVFQNYQKLGEYWNQLVASVAPSEYALSAQDAEGVRLGVRYAKDGDYVKAIRRLIDGKMVNNKTINVDQASSFGFSNVNTELDAIKNIKDKKAQGIAFQRISQQGKLLEFALRTLIESNPERIAAVRREVVVPVASTSSVEDHPDFFVMPTDVSLRTSDIPTTAIQLSFVGYTECLRTFLKQIVESYSKVPLIVRDVQVKPYTGSESSYNTPPSTPGTEGATGGEPVVANNLSQFTVTLEYLEFTPIAIEEEELPAETETVTDETEPTENDGSSALEDGDASEEDYYNEEDEYSY